MTEEAPVSAEEARLQYVTLTRGRVNLYGAAEMIKVYQERNKADAELAAVANAPLEDRMVIKRRYMPKGNDQEGMQRFFKRLGTDEQQHLKARLEAMATRPSVSPEPSSSPSL
ncbi:hypothetical protein MHM84_20270 [Halomonas sp. McH1-25]|uniref:hypothetical protein n=1 Tax=unclassified Halomonas TaxID=2609666 RepID=UPI001EF6AB5A|nr:MULTISPECIES: hypothetical protein [unclassified Halomonas]MCG7602081.1 hypothetical protein [Halomonas sp. McH1-25]MCP1342997.1 hypothetical protein [Halomonas sp. FL8]MCP1362547.1 hypothetical protein [Halomonas sp. BBD45]MCP1366886.1 hypothetical protein [Halomonas sp. BBD48]